MPGLGNSLAAPWRIFRRALTLRTNRIHTLPVVVLMPHSRCNCRCVMCDIWKANDRKQELSAAELAPHVEAFGRLGVRSVVLSGGEPLLHSNLWTLCRLLDQQGIGITLLSTGLTLEHNAADVARWCREVIVSIDGPGPVHDRIRGIEGAFDRLARGIRAVREGNPDCRVTGRCVVQRLNYRHLPELLDAARKIPLDRISLLAADVSSTAFNRPEPWSGERAAQVALDAEQANELETIIEELIVASHDDLEAGFIAESPDKLRRIARHFQALRGARAAQPPRCNAPWVSTVIEADGTVRPCFFHPPLGNIRDQTLDDILNGEHSVAFRRRLDVGTDPTCRDCVCSLHLAPWHDGGPA